MDMNEVILSGRVEHEILDQEVAMALYLHRCDSIATMRVVSAAQPYLYSADAKFSRTHYAYSMRDVHQRIRPVLINQAQAAAGGFGSGRGGMGQGVQTVLLQRTVADVASSSGGIGGGEIIPTAMGMSVGAAGAGLGAGGSSGGGSSMSMAKPPHYDILRLVMDGSSASSVSAGSHSGSGGGLGGLEEILTIDVSRHDVFESIIVFMLVIYFSCSHDAYSSDSSSTTSGHTSGDSSPDHHLHDSSSDDHSEKSSTTSASNNALAGSMDYRIIKHMIEDIAGREELVQLMDMQRTAIRTRAKQNAMMKNMQSAEKLISSGFGFGMGLAYASPGTTTSSSVGIMGGSSVSPMGARPMNLSPASTGGSPHYHHHHLQMPNIAVSSQIRMPSSHHHHSSSPTMSMPTSSTATVAAAAPGMMSSAMFNNPNMNNLRQSNILPSNGSSSASGSSGRLASMNSAATSGAASKKSFRAMFANSDADTSFVTASGASTTNSNDISYVSHNFSRYMNPANPFASPQ